ncbi:hypothetical protein GCM10009798_37420 [Nocardioides panacihumi]|uniref:DUF2877 domain-containing protein n=1 Tax=Nocardioides panacihumi TaxID=400774 RepID=A0ABN2RPN1_9ACTN
MRDRLGRAPDGPLRVVHRGPHSIYLDLDGWCLGVVDAVAAQVPCALRTTSLAGVPGDRADLRGGVLHLDGIPVTVGRMVHVGVPALTASAGSPAPAQDPGSWVARLVGAGDGLTPYGDDVLCGWIAIHRAAGVATPVEDAAVRALLHRTTLLSATLLDCAMHGEVLPEFAAWVAALGTPTERAASVALEAIGHTSGRGMLEGARQALTTLDTAVAA